ncbi:hypothetical protein [Caproicibacter fermentans]|uniref:Uncharacterized protein n=1 Tax=Caproicibacter fermentans TaxID=2576756 RepID=A0A7G8T7I6_9FIRM|nr:hypothetical protein [Caproicibacter fermentans]QNK39577.1 hypothetical protein HCR03_12605 [Caproicibacter fermentans]
MSKTDIAGKRTSGAAALFLAGSAPSTAAAPARGGKPGFVFRLLGF